MLIIFKGIGWISKIQKKKHTFFISISKFIALGNLFNPKQKLYSYLAEEKGRNVLVIYLDGEPRTNESPQIIEHNIFYDNAY